MNDDIFRNMKKQMKPDDALLNSVISKVNTQRKAKQKPQVLKYSLAAACLCGICALCFVTVVLPILKNNTVNSAITNTTDENRTDITVGGDIILSDGVYWYVPDENAEITAEDMSAALITDENNGLKLTENLYNALYKTETDGSRLFAVKVGFSADCPDDYIFEGKTYLQLKNELQEAEMLLEKLSALVKDGEYLKYGERICDSGTPDGEKWSEELYNERTAYYGAEILKKYISADEFLSRLLEEDINVQSAAVDGAFELINRCRAEYKATYAENTVIPLFEKLGFSAVNQNGEAVIFISKEDFMSLRLPGNENYWFSHARKD